MSLAAQKYLKMMGDPEKPVRVYKIQGLKVETKDQTMQDLLKVKDEDASS